MKINSLTIKSIVLSGALLVSTTALASNPFMRPEIKVVEAPAHQDFQHLVSSSLDSLEIETLEIEPEVDSKKEFENPLLSKESVVFRGSMNGVNLYFDKETGSYFYDVEEIETINLLSSSLPELDKVNH